MRSHTNLLRSLGVVLLFSSFSILKADWGKYNPFEQKVFIENKGQFDDKDDLPGSNIRYVIENGARMFFTPAGVTYQMAILEDKEDMEGKKQEERMKVDYSYIHMLWVGSNPLVQIVAEDKVPDYYTYPSRTKRNGTIVADAFKKITYKNLYPNIDVMYEFHPKEGIKYTVILHPGANPSDIQMKYVSTKKVFADEEGNIHLKSIKGDVIDHAPVTFYEDNKQPIKSSFSLSKSNVVSFNLDNYDNTQTVVIDPWTTNPGFAGLNRAYNICKDAAGNLYSTGGVNPFYLKKFSPVGTLIWSFTLPNGQNWSIDNVVDPATGDSYICYGAWSGNVDSKVNTAGTIVFNNTAAQNGSGNTFGEAYELALNCKTGILYGAGFFSGPNTSVWQMNQATGMQSAWVNANPALTIEVRSMETDINGDVYLMSVPLGSAQAGNRLIRMTSALAPIWNINDNYNLTEAQPGFYQGYCCNGINSIAVGCFVYTHDGLTIKKWDKTNGALLGSTNIPGGSIYMCSGMFLDVCGNLYAGSTTGVYKYDQNLVQLSFSGTGGAVYDIINGNIPGEIIAAGNGFISSINMNTCSNLTITTTYTPPTCGLCDAKATATSNACAVTYSWSNGATTNSITNLCGGTYTVSLISGCSSTNVYTTVVIPASGNAFTISSSVVNADCNSATGTVNINSITGSAPTFTLSEGTNTITTTMTPPYAITGVSVGTHTYTVFNSMGCSVTFTAQILNVGVPPNLTATTPVTLGCVPSTVTLNAASTTTGSLTWSWAGTGILSGATTNSPIVNQTGTYTVTLSQGLCTSTTVVTVNPNTTPPNISIALPASLTCAQGSITLNGSSTTNGALFQWTNGPSTATSVVSSAGNYTLTVTDPVNGCTSTATTNVVFVNTLNALATGTNVKCFNGNTGSATVTITGGSGNYTYFWTNNASISSNPQGLTAGVYTVTAKDGFCIITTTVLISQPPALSLAINSNTTNACANTVINVNAFASGGVGPYTYTWSPGPNSSSYNVSEINPGNYTYGLNVTDANGCPVNNSINLTFNPIPVITVASGTVCFGDKAVLSASGAETYQWNPINYSGSTYTTTGSSNLYMTVVGTNTSTGCSSLPVTSTLIANPLPVPDIAVSNNAGCIPVCVTFTANNSGGSVQNCSWDFGDGSFASNVVNTDRCFTMAGDYTVTATVTDANGCVAKITTTVSAYPIPVADFNWAPIKPIVNRDEVTFTDASFNAVIKKWDWYFADLPKPHSYVQNPVYQYMDAGTYPVALLVTSDHGCVDTIMKVIIVGEDYGIYVPNIFTPNGDGLNDIFQPKGFGITKYELRLFNRWGEELMFTNDFDHGWDGFYKGKLSQEDIYVWKINLTDVFGKSHELTGHVTLIK